MIAAVPAEHIPYFDAPHCVALALAPTVPALLAWLAKAKDDERWTRRLGFGLAGVLIANEIAYRTFHFSEAKDTAEFLEHSLPINLCPLALFAGCFALWRRSQVAYEICYFWGIAGTLNALLTPDITWRFPSFGFIGYFTAHCGVLWAALYATWSLGLRPNWRSVLRAFILLNATGCVLGLLNLLIGGEANYAFLRQPPEVETPFIIGPWPWYLGGLELVSASLFVLAYLPFWWMDRRTNRCDD